MENRIIKFVFVLFTIVLLCAGIGCSDDDGDDCKDSGGYCGPDDDDDDNDDDAICEEGQRQCDEDYLPQECIDGQWVTLAPCGKWSYCNFGECQETLIQFPEDEGVHNSVVEWWYYTGHLFDEEGNTYGFELTFWLMCELINIPVWMVHAGIVDEAGGYHEMNNTMLIEQPPDDPTKFELLKAGMEMIREDDGSYNLLGDTENFVFDLNLSTDKQPVYHGGNGVVRMSSKTEVSYYYSRTALDVQGTLTKDGVDKAVTGQAWMDHQWGNFLPFVLVGWDWFSIQLDNDYEIMLFIFRSTQEFDPNNFDLAAGSIIDPYGNQETILHEDFVVTPQDTWESETTGGVYPQNWRVEIPRFDVDLMIQTNVPNQEMPNIVWDYWEGRVEIEGTHQGEDVTGMGFVELSGYSGPPIFWWLFDQN